MPPSTRTHTTDPARQLQRALAHYLDLPTLRRLVADYGQQTEGAALDVRSALLAPDAEQPAEVRMLLTALASMLRPFERIQIRQPADIAAFLMADMGQLEQEEMRVMYLSTKAEVIQYGGADRAYLGAEQLGYNSAQLAESRALRLAYFVARYRAQLGLPWRTATLPIPKPSKVDWQQERFAV